MADEDLDKILDDIRGVDRKIEAEKVMAEADKIIGKHSVPDKAPFLEILAKVYMIIGYIVAIGTGIALLYGLVVLVKAFNADIPLEPVVFIILYRLIFGAIGAVTCLAISEGIKLFVNIEVNSRKQVLLLSKLFEDKKGQ